jgi:hypothetical protein
MKRTVPLFFLASILAGLSTREARAEEPSCSQVTVESAASVDARWPRLSRRVRDAFEARDDVDRCARIVLSSRDGGIGVEVSLPDGRSARRVVSGWEDVIPAIEALVIVPQAASLREETSSLSAAPVTVPSPASAPSPTEDTVLPVVVSAPPREALAPGPAQSSSRLRIELSLMTGARIGDGQTGLGLGAVSFLDLSRWLVGFAGRLDRYETFDGAHAAGALELALLGGRSLRFGTMALDLIGGPAIALGGTSRYQSESQTGMIQTGSASNTVPRALLEARVVFAVLSTVRTFVAVDGDFGPASSPDASRLPNASRLPTWTAGLALGATVGTP